MIERLFQDIPEDKIEDADDDSLQIELGWWRGENWTKLLQSPRVLLISQAGAGKTYECREQAKKLCDAGEIAFFLDLAALAEEEPEDDLLKKWLSTQSEVATFFLDSIDELNLSQKTLEQALKRLKKTIGDNLHRTKIVITTRPTPFDKKCVENLLPVPPRPTFNPEQSFVEMATDSNWQRNKKVAAVPDWRTVRILPLTDQQIIEFAKERGVDNAEEMVMALQQHDALEFVRYPQSLIELCTDWKTSQQIHRHLDQVDKNILVALLPGKDRSEKAELSLDQAMDGVGRIALAMQTTRRLTVRHSAAADKNGNGAALDPVRILSDWQPSEIKALLERPIFCFASYGRVRFQHRSQSEYLAAKHLLTLRQRGMSYKALCRIIFAETKGKIVVRPSKRAIAAWLAIKEKGIFEILRDHEPAVLLDEGDSESLSVVQKKQVLKAFANRYGKSGWRGMQIPPTKIHRFACADLADEINRIWEKGIENPEVREIFLQLIEFGKIRACAEVAYRHAINSNISTVERINAIEALVALDDPRLSVIANAISQADAEWSDELVNRVIVRLFPKHLTVQRLCDSLERLKDSNSSEHYLNWNLPTAITNAELDHTKLEQLCETLLRIISVGLRWDEKRFLFTTNRLDLCEALAATCLKLRHNKTDTWCEASVLIIRLYRDEYYESEWIKSLREHLSQLDAVDSARLFWAEDALGQLLCKFEDPGERFSLIYGGPYLLKPNRDLPWICDALRDLTRCIKQRLLLLEAAMRLIPPSTDPRVHLEELKSYVQDNFMLLDKIDERLKPSIHEVRREAWKEQEDERITEEALKKAKHQSDWANFRRDVINCPDDFFSNEKAKTAVWNLWRVMSNHEEYRRTCGWSRQFIEQHFNKEIADRARHVFMNIWRQEQPLFLSERIGEENCPRVSWQFGLAGLYAEAEDPCWAAPLSEKDVQLALRYAPLHTGTFPHWLEALATAHPISVEEILGRELSWELDFISAENGNTYILQNLSYAEQKLARLFVPRLLNWLITGSDLNAVQHNAKSAAEKIRLLTRVILKHGDTDAHSQLADIARARLRISSSFDVHYEWLFNLLKINPESGVEVFERVIAHVEPAERTEAVTWFATLFGGRRETINVRDESFTPTLLLRLLRLAYHHVRIEHDVHHEHGYSPDVRDDAQTARNAIVTALLDAKGDEAWRVKCEMASDPLCKHFKDRIIAVAEEIWAQEIDSDQLTEAQTVDLIRNWEAPILTNEAMFGLIKDRLSDIDESLLRDDSPRELWASINEERLMRREIAGKLDQYANGLYHVVQESVTADEKETDFRLVATASQIEGVIELKLAAKYSAAKLCQTIRKQLLEKYLQPQNRRAGALLLTYAQETKGWQHPSDNIHLDIDGLIRLLRDEAQRVEEEMAGHVKLYIHLLDLRPRVRKERIPKVKKQTRRLKSRTV